MKKTSFICDRSAREYFQAACLHIKTTEDFVLKANELYQSSPHEITTGCTILGKLIKRRANAVLREIHQLSAYIRLKPLPEMLLVGKCHPDHKTGHLIAKSLAKRFGNFIILVITPNDNYLATERTDILIIPEFKEQDEKILIHQIREFADKILTERLPVEFLLEDGDFLWEQYYETQFLEQRLNKRLFHRFIPKYVMKKANMNIEKKFYEDVLEKPEETRTLDNFFKKNAIVK
ncbi:MAG: DUF4130 domain-containing protein [Candidatus Heimdallarchaeota archaeon]|nr:DUF4130 domain-containing protein [Candidatus Heimdallarchaeota archaeon]MCK4769385.1 DUF4130 domain-containing protein [Candidatus Heimdallarchaeota archaeon]